MVRSFISGAALLVAVPAAAQTVYDPVKCRASSVKPNFRVALLGASLPGGPRPVGYAKFASGADLVTLNLDNRPAADNTFGATGVKISMIQIDYAVTAKTPKLLSDLSIDVQIGAKKAPPVVVDNRYSFTNDGKTINVVLPIERLIAMKPLESERGDWRFTLLQKGKPVVAATVREKELDSAKLEAVMAWVSLDTSFAQGKCKA